MIKTTFINHRKTIIRNYIITYFLIAFSGIPFFDDGNGVTHLLFMLILAGIFFYRKRQISKNLLLILIISFGLLFIQTYLFGGKSYFTFLSFTGLVILTPYFGIKIIGPPFLKYYRNIILIIALISIPFWLATNFIPGFFEYTYSIAGKLMPYTNWTRQESLIIYTVENAQAYGFHRNPGPFHEPGAFAVFLILAIIADIFIKGTIFTKRNAIFIFCIITTFSTAGYIALFILFSFYFATTLKMHVFLKLLIFSLALPFFIYLFINLEFLNQKIAMQYSEATSTSLDTQTSGRFLGARKALLVIKNHPLYGRGLLAATQPEQDSVEAAGYGWIFWVSRLGIIFGPIYLYFLYRTIKNYSIVNGQKGLFPLIAFLAILAVLAGQKHTSSIIVFMLFLISIEFPLKNHFQYYSFKKENNI